MTAHRGLQASLVLTAALLLHGCSSKVDVEKVPLGTKVEVTRQDGGVITGSLSGRDDQIIRVDTGRATRAIPRVEVASLVLVDRDVPTPVTSTAKFREYTIPAGTKLSARLETALASDSSRVEESVEATLTEPELVDGVEVLPAGSTLRGKVTVAEKSGNVKGRASLGVEFRSITVAGGNGTYPISTGMQHTAPGTKGDDAKKIGIPAAGGALIGALVGGKKGALIGTAIGGGAGAAVVLTTSGPEVRYARGVILSLSLRESIDVRVPIRK